VPGYRGYKAKDLIRQDDFLIRTSVKSKLENALNELAELEGRLVSVSPFNPQLKRIEFVASKIRTLISELVSAQGGGADVYARYKISTEQLDEIVKNDLNMIQLADQAYQLALSGNVDRLRVCTGLDQADNYTEAGPLLPSGVQVNPGFPAFIGSHEFMCLPVA